jgi:hypothetical protein
VRLNFLFLGRLFFLGSIWFPLFFVFRSLGKEEHGGGSLSKRSEQQNWHGCSVQIFAMEVAGSSMVLLTLGVYLFLRLWQKISWEVFRRSTKYYCTYMEK